MQTKEKGTRGKEFEESRGKSSQNYLKGRKGKSRARTQTTGRT